MESFWRGAGILDGLGLKRATSALSPRHGVRAGGGVLNAAAGAADDRHGHRRRVSASCLIPRISPATPWKRRRPIARAESVTQGIA